MNTLTGQFVLSAEIDGTTINAVLIASEPLEQWYNGADHAVIPDWENNQSLRPTIFLIVRDTTTGKIIANSSIKNLKWKYNQVEVTFRDGESLNSNAEFPALFERAEAQPPSQNTLVPSLKVRKNFPQFGDYDNDVITVEGSVEYDGQEVHFKDIDIDVIIKEKTGDIFSVKIVDDENFHLENGIRYTHSKAILRRGGFDMDAQSMKEYSFVWEELTSAGYRPVRDGMVNQSDSSKITINRDDIKSLLQLRCSAIKTKLQSTVANVVVTYTDGNDPLVIINEITLKGGGKMTGKVHRGETAVVTPKVKSRDYNKDYTADYDMFYRLIQNNGSYLGGETQGQNIEITYAKIIEGGMKIKGNVTAKKRKQ